MKSLRESDSQFYHNELFLDTTNGETLATTELKDLIISEKGAKLFLQWKNVLIEVKQRSVTSL
ncbi:hypothetical protein [Streptococcus ruminantium]|uniref:Uncharacterized protein n=1 Tax=Streptococcus ruminantium TaxID=1917441 RepID=A0A2Z5TMF9_9STRE|nr:hypothetical protein [Streptococcus ruminantium]BBA92506.1 hypothetical protein SR187_4490 [Streptococcus ruminantium]